MAKASEQFRQSDVTLWGLIALVCAGLAVFGSNISLLVPQSIIGGLHQPRVAGASIETLRLEVGQLRDDTSRLRHENELLLSRFALQEKSGSEIVRRVGALEVTVPQMVEAQPESRPVDRASVTASIGSGEILSFDAEGGSVSVRQSILPQAMPAIDQPLPVPVSAPAALAVADQNAYGIAIGAAVPFEQAPAMWNDLTLKLGPLLLDLAPLLADAADGNDKRILAGPISELAEATALCQRFERISIACMPMPYDGTPLALAP
ncbi:hypothetical protein O9Z70_06960 [Devosia sp. YIM 151766]|uniref:hypothetical protein n=1 Tax=Devosia sp. YIM 151766 TaxID=3017325 RepID=UPI00255CADF7|nr:hypothetical protein [Devosia sp. YIM 151766]WIY54253.1 hypothetical protein O9Z70_06960 [Devosia sp. YIM 151766]